MHKRGTTNGNHRGNTKDRARRKAYLLRAYASDVPGHCRCYRCGTLLSAATITVDRIVPGARGGKYVRNNIRPACGKCNSATANAAKPSAPPAPASIWALDFARLGREIQAARLMGRIAG